MYKEYIKKAQGKIDEINQYLGANIRLNSRLFLNGTECTLEDFYAKPLEYTAKIIDKETMEIDVGPRKYTVGVVQKGKTYNLNYEFEGTAWREQFILDEYIQDGEISDYRLAELAFDVELIAEGLLHSEIESIFEPDESIVDENENYLEAYGTEIFTVYEENRGK